MTKTYVDPIFAHYKKIAPAGDIAFVRAIASPELQAHIDSLVKPTKVDAARVTCLWRMERAKAIGWATDPEILADAEARAEARAYETAMRLQRRDKAYDNALAGQATDESEAA